MGKNKKENSSPRTLIWDIETSPILGYTWGIWQQNVINVKDDWQILTVAWKWLGDKKVHCLGQDDMPGYKPGANNDLEIVKVIHKLLDEADIAISHNGKSFDERKAQARMMIHKMSPPSPFKSIDTLQAAKRYGAFTSNKLKYLASDLKVSQKGDPGGFETWLGCMAGDKKAWKKMKKYNLQDIPPLEEIYIQLRPWITNHPNMARIADRPDACPKCGVEGKMQSRGTRVTNVCKYRRFQCTSCGGWCCSRPGYKKDEDIRPVYVNFSG